MAKRNDVAAAAPKELGARLQAARDSKGMSQQQCAERLYVEARVIAALETEQFASLGGGVYARGHLRRYAELLGEDPAEFEQLLLRTSNAAATPDIASITTRPMSQPPRAPRIGIWPVAILAILLALAALIRWAVTTTRSGSTPTTTITVPVEPTAPGSGSPP